MPDFFTRHGSPLKLLLQRYLAFSQVTSVEDASELGPSIALHFGKATGPIDRKLCALLYSSPI